MTTSRQDLYYAAIAPREGCRQARSVLEDHYRLTLEGDEREAALASLSLLNAVSLIDLFERTLGEGSYLECLRIHGNSRG